MRADSAGAAPPAGSCRQCLRLLLALSSAGGAGPCVHALTMERPARAATTAAQERVQATPGLLVRIMEHLGTPCDAARAAATCRTWRDAATADALENSL